MPVLQPGAGTPTVSVSVPVPTPVQTKKPRPSGPVSFGGEQQPQAAPTQPVQPTQGQQPVPLMPRQMSAVILPWSPGPERKSRLPRKRVRFAKPVRYAAPINAVNYGETAHEALTRFLGGRPRRAHGRSARIERLANGDIGVFLHGHQIVTAHNNGQVTLNHHGFMTPTTRRFMSGYSGLGVSFAGGRFMIGDNGQWREYENGTHYPVRQEPNAFPERGRLSPDQRELLRQHHLTGENTPLGMLGDSLTESGYPHTGGLLSRLATGDPGTGGTFIGEYHPSYQQSPVLGEYDFHFTPGLGKNDLHELHIEIPRSESSGTRGQFRVVGSKPLPTQMSRQHLTRRMIRTHLS